MIQALNSPYIVPLGAFAVAIVVVGFGAWRKVREMEIKHDFEMRNREMEHQLKLKQLELDGTREPRA
jgi:hypothetical protein